MSQSREFCRHNPLCCFSTSVYCCKRIFRYRLSPETFGYTLVRSHITHVVEKVTSNYRRISQSVKFVSCINLVPLHVRMLLHQAILLMKSAYFFCHNRGTVFMKHKKKSRKSWYKTGVLSTERAKNNVQNVLLVLSMFTRSHLKLTTLI
jgi:hypothetical protein